MKNEKTRDMARPPSKALPAAGEGWPLWFKAAVGGVLAMLLAAMAWMLAPGWAAGSKVDDAVNLALRVIKGVDGQYASMPNFTSLAGRELDFVDGVKLSGLAIKGPWGDVGLAPATWVFPNDSWVVSFNGVPSAECSQALIQIAPFFGAYGANNVWSAAPGAELATAEEAAKLCSAPSNVVMFKAKNVREEKPAARGVKCAAPKRMSADNTACVAPIRCQSPTVPNADMTACVASCSRPEVLNEDKTACIVVRACAHPMVANAENTECVSSCAPARVLNAAANACAKPVECEPPKVSNAAKNACELHCAEPKKLNAAGDGCVMVCQPPLVADMMGTECVEVPVCGYPLALNPSRNGCAHQRLIY